jgi:hypothetical protein
MRRGGCSGGKQLSTKRNQRTAAAAGEETEVSDADEAARQHMQQKPTQELIDRQSQESLLVFMSGISPAKRNSVIHERDETAIGDRHAMGVSAEVAKHLLRSAESWFAIDHPARNKQLTYKTPKQSGLRQTLEEAMELELSGCISLLERGDEFPTEELAESPNREEELVVPGAYPLRVIPGQAAGGHDAVSVGMVL